MAWLQIAPGIPAVAAYALFARILTANYVPNIMALPLASVFVEVPVVWWLMLRLARAEGQPLSWRTLFPWRERVSWQTYAFLAVPAALFSFVMIILVAPAVQRPMVETVFSWVPDWFVMRADPTIFASLSRVGLFSLWAWTLLMVVAAGATQALYFRGFWLPRMTELGRWAPWLNAVTFAVYHMAAPWGWGVFFVGTLPWALLVWWKRSVRLALFLQLAPLLLQWLLLTLVVFGVVPIPA